MALNGTFQLHQLGRCTLTASPVHYPATPAHWPFSHSRVHSHAPSIRSHRGIKVVWPDFQPMRVPEEPVCVHLFRQKPVFTSLHLKSPVHVHRLWVRRHAPSIRSHRGKQKWFDRISSQWESQKNRFALIYFGKIRFLPPCIWNNPFMSTASA